MRLETRREKALRLKKQRRSSIIGMVIVFLLVLLVGVSVWNAKQSLSRQNREYEEQIAELEEQIEQQKNRETELNEYKKYIQTKKFVEKVAKDKFGLLYPDEILFKPNEK